MAETTWFWRTVRLATAARVEIPIVTAKRAVVRRVENFMVNVLWFHEVDARAGGTCVESRKFFSSRVSRHEKAPAGVLPGLG